LHFASLTDNLEESQQLEQLCKLVEPTNSYDPDQLVEIHAFKDLLERKHSNHINGEPALEISFGDFLPVCNYFLKCIFKTSVEAGKDINCEEDIHDVPIDAPPLATSFQVKRKIDGNGNTSDDENNRHEEVPDLDSTTWLEEKLFL
jgi:hypothetical protein